MINDECCIGCYCVVQQLKGAEVMAAVKQVVTAYVLDRGDNPRTVKQIKKKLKKMAKKKEQARRKSVDAPLPSSSVVDDDHKVRDCFSLITD
jgi:hypothetical protein